MNLEYLLIGGQACVLYGGAEFSRNTDIVILHTGGNVENLREALTKLNADNIAVPPFKQDFLDKGHAIHFRCQREDVKNMRLDVMAKMRNVPPFTKLWANRTTVEVDGLEIQVMSIPDLVASKKTQRDKDWRMIKSLLEANYNQNAAMPSQTHIDLWLRELRTPEHLCEVAKENALRAQALIMERPLLEWALSGNLDVLNDGLFQEETIEREKDRVYWNPLFKELELLRRESLQKKNPEDNGNTDAITI